jgi:hypothetical protein
MADTKTSALTAANAIGATDIFPIVQGANPTAKATAAQLRTFAQAGLRHPGYVAGRWYPVHDTGAVSATSALSAGSIRFLPFSIREAITLSDLAARVTTLTAAGNFQIAIYASHATTKHPTGTALAATGNMSTASATVVSADITGSDVTIQPGNYWSAVNVDNGTTAFSGASTSSPAIAQMIGSATLANVSSTATGVALYLSLAQTFGTWPDVTAGGFTEVTGNGAPIIFVKVSAVP